MSATHMAMASGASIPESRAMLSHLDACVPRRSMTRSKSNMPVSAPGLGGTQKPPIEAVGGAVGQGSLNATLPVPVASLWVRRRPHAALPTSGRAQAPAPASSAAAAWCCALATALLRSMSWHGPGRSLTPGRGPQAPGTSRPPFSSRCVGSAPITGSGTGGRAPQPPGLSGRGDKPGEAWNQGAVGKDAVGERRLLDPQVVPQQPLENGAQVDGWLQITALVQVGGLEPRPIRDHAAALERSARQ